MAHVSEVRRKFAGRIDWRTDGWQGVANGAPLVNFFNNRSDAESWVKSNRLLGDLVTVQELAPQAADLWRDVTHPAD